MTNKETLERLAEADRLLGPIKVKSYPEDYPLTRKGHDRREWETDIAEELLVSAQNHLGMPEWEADTVLIDKVIRRADEIQAYIERYKDSPLAAAVVEVSPGAYTRREATERTDCVREALGEQEPIGRPISRAETLRISQAILERAEQGRRDLAEHEASIGHEPTQDDEITIPPYDPTAKTMSEMVAEISATVPDEEWAKLPRDLSKRNEPEGMTADELLAMVHERLGNFPIDLRCGIALRTTGFARTVNVQWKRFYDNDILSDERQASASTITGALQAILDWEDKADRAEGSDYDYEADCAEADAADAQIGDDHA